jgi:hypothetical protein
MWTVVPKTPSEDEDNFITAFCISPTQTITKTRAEQKLGKTWSFIRDDYDIVGVTASINQ